MLWLVAAILFAIFGFIAKKAGMGGAAKLFGLTGFVCCMVWLASGAGAAIIDFFENGPDVNIPDSVPIPGPETVGR